MQQEKTDIVKSVMSIRTILINVNNMKAHLNDNRPTFYQVCLFKYQQCFFQE